MADENISMFCAFTEATPEQAQQYLALTDGNVEQAVELFFNNPDLGATAAAAAARPAPTSNRDNPVTIDDDEDGDEVQEVGSRNVGAGGFEDDEAMARRLQEEMYGGPANGGQLDEDGVRAPMARTTETLVGPDADWMRDPNEMRAAVAEQLMERQRRRAAGPGIFNQREVSSIWTQENAEDPEAHRQMLSRATGGASDQTSKSNLLADLFRPPFDLISQLSFSAARDEGKEDEKWILVNVQDPSIFDCQVLNRDIWKNQSIRDTIKEHFIFMQYNKEDPRGQEYVNYYFRTMLDNEDAYPHIAIIDPRTGEQVKTWSGSPAPKPADFLMDLHEFLDRYSLRMDTKNPVQTKRRESKKDIAQMSEEEMLEMALQNSLANGSGSGPRAEEDPDALTRSEEAMNGKGKAPIATSELVEAPMQDAPPASDLTTTSTKDTAFAAISSTNPHIEPASTDPKETTRIQFRYSGGRVVHRFMLADTVRRIYEWLKASPLEGQDGDFELISMGKNLIDTLDVTISEAGLKQGTVMVEFLQD
ncbi:UBX domain-containing protein 2 [Neohortaea acidophila]|uniref:UBX domain-containing protein 2 n=1 Tax=Neohortaea acidophila TaxID=245834 RepID=A0A6A6PKE6_9PEZI|nr:UBX domain-containing protein 2 [Neohortaea acidophila]KAF2480530.1 UBX domain-containing protein 2 [Neohortaea acidophila]